MVQAITTEYNEGMKLDDREKLEAPYRSTKIWKYNGLLKRSISVVLETVDILQSENENTLFTS